ncbi:N-acetylglucosaminyldiphosphoundecaprenol N-acetyl-beta-D-mannosaminyltransferase [Mycetocola sp. BIGb0189]|uniref:WecB/TagA/CpsF family glycosyltransferase n=1 Tax=Mycetocola sp. BIGb0189 TaxID=2940604 RepID=UPI002168DBE8|nr:WecB/TagA/CpsF family glycosyltransferase [Mycetocola sp. BIGb0189]MCS4275675.1 N-acetylglucosaminyldiphosphoundecaprenol N-acetyl-beta-D-mannosaminyltransferase [Mycetocola sp. BIGb0189]
MSLQNITTTAIAGLPVCAIAPEAASTAVCEAAAKHEAADIHLANAFVVSLAHQDERYHDLLAQSAAIFPDGKPLTWASRIKRGNNLSQVRGPSLFENVISEGRATGLRHFFLGNTPETLAMLTAELEHRYPGMIVAGVHSPPFRALSETELAAQDELIRQTRPDIVWVGLGTPKQDAEARRVAEELGLVAIAIGAAFDFIAGTKKEAPEILSKLGLEWVFRFASEPRRLWRRYLIGNLVFSWAVLKPRAKRVAA